MMSDSDMTLVIGESMQATAKWLKQRFGIPPVTMWVWGWISRLWMRRIAQLAALTSCPVPIWITRQRERLQDAMLDTHVVLSGETLRAIALEADLATGYGRLLASIGGQISQVVSRYGNSGVGGLTCAADQRWVIWAP
ncbi:nitrogenase component 1 [Vibrio sp. PP-XX7]